MSGGEGDDLEARFAAIHDRFRARLRARLEQVRGLRDELSHAPGDEEVLGRVKTLAHNLSGSSGTFGFPQVGVIAAELEAATKIALQQPGAPHRLVEGLDRLAAEIEASV